MLSSFYWEEFSLVLVLVLVTVFKLVTYGYQFCFGTKRFVLFLNFHVVRHGCLNNGLYNLTIANSHSSLTV